MAHSQEENKSLKVVPENTKVSDLPARHYNNYLKYAQRAKKNTDQEPKETRKIIYEQNENINNEIEFILKGPKRNSGAEKFSICIEKFTRT